MGSEQRRNPRVAGYAKAVFTQSMTPGYIRDISADGCQVAFMQPLPVASGDEVTIRVIAVHDPSVAPFALTLRVRWVKNDQPWSLVGGETNAPTEADARSRDALVTYYAGAGT